MAKDTDAQRREDEEALRDLPLPLTPSDFELLRPRSANPEAEKLGSELDELAKKGFPFRLRYEERTTMSVDGDSLFAPENFRWVLEHTRLVYVGPRGPKCDVCGKSAEGGQSTGDSVLCEDCIRKTRG